MGVPLNHHFNRIFPYKSSILGYPHFSGNPHMCCFPQKLEGVDRSRVFPSGFEKVVDSARKLRSSGDVDSSIIYGLESNQLGMATILDFRTWDMGVSVNGDTPIARCFLYN